jgi:hypothetical protein
MSNQITDLQREADLADFRCSFCQGIDCNCDQEPGEPDGI